MRSFIDQVKEDEHAARMGRRRMYIGFWWEIQERPLGKQRCGWEDNIKMY
jgi:hypothetical protein